MLEVWYDEEYDSGHLISWCDKRLWISETLYQSTVWMDISTSLGLTLGTDLRTQASDPPTGLWPEKDWRMRKDCDDVRELFVVWQTVCRRASRIDCHSIQTASSGIINRPAVFYCSPGVYISQLGVNRTPVRDVREITSRHIIVFSQYHCDMSGDFFRWLRYNGVADKPRDACSNCTVQQCSPYSICIGHYSSS